MLKYFFSLTLSFNVPPQSCTRGDLIADSELTLSNEYWIKFWHQTNSLTSWNEQQCQKSSFLLTPKACQAFFRWFSCLYPSSNKGKPPSFLNYTLSRNCGSPNSLSFVYYRCHLPRVTCSRDVCCHYMTVSGPGSLPSVRFHCDPLDHPSSEGL